MTTQKQIEANRRNAQKSTGPRTQVGKDAARLNAVKHGLRTLAVEVLPNEDADAFERLLVGWVRDLDPRTEAELTLARQAATISWKLDRAERYETAVLSRRVIEAVNACDCADDDANALHEAAAIASFDPSSEGERLRRYQFALMRELRQTIDAIGKLKKQSIAPNEAISGTETIAPNEPNTDDLTRPGSPDPAQTNDRRTHKQDRELTLPACENIEDAGGHGYATTNAVPTTNEPNSEADTRPIVRRGRDRWPLETIKRKQRNAKRRERQCRERRRENKAHQPIFFSARGLPSLRNCQTAPE